MSSDDRSGAILATPEEIEAEEIALELLAEPKLKPIQEELAGVLAATPTGQIKAGTARIPEAIAQWTTLVILHQIAHYRPAPTFIWTLNDSPRTWLGHTLGAAGAGAANPDNIYRMAYLDGDGRYEVTGNANPSQRPAQISFEVYRGDPTKPAADWLTTQTKDHSDFDNAVAMITDRSLAIGADGSFSFTLGGPGEGPNHAALKPGILTLLTRDTLSDWAAQRPTRLAIRRLDPVQQRPIDREEIRRTVLEDLAGFVRFSSAFPHMWFGGLAPNTMAGPVPRDRGWGFNAGLRFELEPDEGALITITRGGADYMAVQGLDPWMIPPGGFELQTSLNNTQSAPNPDGSFTYVISPTDTGVANWIDSVGLDEGLAVLRWQGMPPGATKDDLLREFKIVKLSALSQLSGLPRATDAERQAQFATRAETYASRLR